MIRRVDFRLSTTLDMPTHIFELFRVVMEYHPDRLEFSEVLAIDQNFENIYTYSFQTGDWSEAKGSALTDVDSLGRENKQANS